jgi:hypothetical protein
MCNDTQLLYCFSNRCSCSAWQYWNVSYSLCANIQTIYTPCTQDYQCDYRALLICLNQTCNCENSYYWNQTYCNPRKTFNVYCSASYNWMYECQNW